MTDQLGVLLLINVQHGLVFIENLMPGLKLFSQREPYQM